MSPGQAAASRGRRRRPRRGAGPVAWALALLALAAAPAAATAPAPADSLAPAPPGRLLDLGGYRLHLWCMGAGDPTVVLVPGASDFSFGWWLVQPEVAKFARVCAFDRGGEAWSDLGPRPRDKTQEAFDLRRALRAAGETGPYVLVGQSMGGDVVRLFALAHPDEVAGIVLVDPAHPDAMTNLDGRVGTTRSFSRGRAIPAPRESLAADDRLTDEGVGRIREAVAKYHLEPTLDPPFDRLPAEPQRWRLWALAQPKHFVAYDSDYLGEEAEYLYAALHASPPPLAEIPLIVLCRDTTVERSHDPLHVAHAREQAAMSRRGELRIVRGAGHEIHVDAPGAVVQAIRDVIREAQARRGR